jgi:hypothetical protein
METLTVDELTALLKKYPSGTKVYVSRDSEGNGYGTVSTDSIEYGKADGAVILFPVREHLEFDEVFPNQWEAESEQDERSVD